MLGGASGHQFMELLKKNNINTDNIYYVGYIPDKDASLFYSFAEWFVYTSEYEGFGLSPLEVMQCGCPVITSNNTSLPEVVGDSGILIDYDSEEQHIKAYEVFYFEEEIREAYIQKGLQRAKEFSWNITTEKIYEIMMNNRRKSE